MWAYWVTPNTYLVGDWAHLKNMRVHQVGSWNPHKIVVKIKKCLSCHHLDIMKRMQWVIAQFQSHPIFCTPPDFLAKVCKSPNAMLALSRSPRWSLSRLLKEVGLGERIWYASTSHWSFQYLGHQRDQFESRNFRAWNVAHLSTRFYANGLNGNKIIDTYIHPPSCYCLTVTFCLLGELHD